MLRKKLFIVPIGIITIIGIVFLWVQLSNPYLNYYKKSDLDTNIYQIIPQYEIQQAQLNRANEDIESQVSDNVNSGLIN